ncbi:hypothetical protein D3C85_1277330 [compost metagenome]
MSWTVGQATIVLNVESVTRQATSRQWMVRMESASLGQIIYFIPKRNTAYIDGLNRASRPHEIHAMKPLIIKVIAFRIH